MKFVFGVMIALCLTAHAQTKITASWTNPNTALPVCSTTATPPITAACIQNQTITYKLTTATAPPTVASGAILPTANTYTITPLPSPGVYTLSLTQAFLDFSGVPQTTAAATATVTVPAAFVVAVPTGFSGTIQ